MGEDIPPEIPPVEYGNNCTCCFDAGKAPKYIEGTFSGVQLCPGRSWPSGISLNSTWILTQKPANPCLWEYLTEAWQIIWRANLAVCTKSNLVGYGRISPVQRAYYFHSNDVVGACLVNFDNALKLVDCDGRRGHGGTGYVYPVV